MTIEVACPRCGHRLSYDEGRETEARCPHCLAYVVPGAPGRTAADARLTLAEVEAAGHLVRRLTEENVGLQVGLAEHQSRRRRVAARLSTLQFVLRSRQMLDETLGRVGGFFIGITLGGVVPLLLMRIFSPTVFAYFVAAVVGAMLAGLAFTLLAFVPRDAVLAAALPRVAERWEQASREYEQAAGAEAIQREQLSAAELRYRQLKDAIESRLHWLRSCAWQQMAGLNFENFLSEVFRERGYEVQRIGGTGDQGVDLIVARGKTRIAVQAKGYLASAVGNDAVQQVHAGMTYYGCQRSAVITNARFTSSARELAARVGCTLVEGSQMLELIDGRIIVE